MRARASLVTEAIARRENAIPRLLASLDDIETRANPLLVRIFSRPGEFAFELASNVATQDLGRMLASLSAGEPDGMMALIGNRGTPSRPRRRPGGHQKHRLAGEHSPGPTAAVPGVKHPVLASHDIPCGAALGGVSRKRLSCFVPILYCAFQALLYWPQRRRFGT